MLKKIQLLALCTVSAFAMHTLEININDKDLELGGRLDLAQFNDANEPDTVFVGAKFLHGSEEHSDFNAKNIEDFYELNFLMRREVANSGLVVGLGLKMNHTKDFESIPLGIEMMYKLPINDIIPLYLGGNIYYAPEVLSLNDASNFLEYRLNLDIEVIKNGSVTLGYRSLDTNYDVAGKTSNVNYNKSAYLGFRFAF